MLCRISWTDMYRYVIISLKQNNNFLHLKDRVTTTKPSPLPPLNIGAIMAGIFGGILLTLIIGLVIYFIRKRRVKKTMLKFSPSNSTTKTISSSEPVIVPALYDLSSPSRRDSNVTSAATMTYHLYEELPIN